MSESMASWVVFLALSLALSVDLAAALPIHRSFQRSPLAVFSTSRINASASELAAYSIFVMALLFSVIGAFALARAREANALAVIASFRRGGATLGRRPSSLPLAASDGTARVAPRRMPSRRGGASYPVAAAPRGRWYQR
ncbi:hypothetical protein BC826DRAFT_1019158 [Russula brevipes]|nr:hypothetical protein BC826DRAFT_1019158 [Russula brevipes]